MSPYLSFRNGVIAFSLAVILLFAGGITLYQHGKHAGEVSQRLKTDKHTLTVTQHAAQEADVKVQGIKGKVILQSAHVTQEKARVTRAMAPITLTATSASVDGDSTPAVVIPALVKAVHAYQQLDSAHTGLDTLRAEQVALQDTAIQKHQAVEASAVKVIADEDAVKAPRCGAKCGAVVTVAVILAGAFTAHHFGVHF